MIRPQQKQRKKHEEALRALKSGDEIVTAGGIVGEVIHIREIGDGEGGDDAPLEDRDHDQVGRVAARSSSAARSRASSASTRAPQRQGVDRRAVSILDIRVLGDPILREETDARRRRSRTSSAR